MRWDEEKMAGHELKPSAQDYVRGRLEKEGMQKYRVPFAQHFAGWVHGSMRPFWRLLGKLEALAYEENLEFQVIDRPVYICGLARSGTTILLELLNETGQFATHRYRDYPFIDIPILWNAWQRLMPGKEAKSCERAHLDGITVTPDSPEALEEMIWMPFFPDLHQPGRSSVVDDGVPHPAFEHYYKMHIRKMLMLRKAARYLAKSNYNVTRILYLLKLFPQAKFVVPVRNPVEHIESLMKQHTLFCAVQADNTRALHYMQWTGHYEFGLDRRIVNTGNAHAVQEIQKCWNEGDEIGGWACYWAMLHNWLYQTLSDNAFLNARVRIVDYKTLCTQPEQTLRFILEQCEIDTDDEMLRRLAQKIRSPSYYKSGFSEGDVARIKDLTAQTHRHILSLL